MTKKMVKVDIGTARTHSKMDRETAFLVEKYIERHPQCFTDDGSVDLEAIIEWALETGLYRPVPLDPRVQLRRRISRHFGHRYVVDPQGRQTRALVAVPRERITPQGVRRSFGYYPLYHTEADIVFGGLDLRRTWAYKRIEQIDTDWHSYDDNNVLGQKLKPMSFNFDAVLARKAQPTTYPKSAPDDTDEEDELD